MTGKDFLTFAKTLQNSESEAARRSSVSRAYYALYHHVKEYLVSSGRTVSKNSTEHQRFVWYLKYSGIEEIRQIGKKMNDLRLKRNAADYELADTGFNKLTCEFYCASIEEMINAMDSSDKDSLFKGFAAYARLINEK